MDRSTDRQTHTQTQTLWNNNGNAHMLSPWLTTLAKTQINVIYFHVP